MKVIYFYPQYRSLSDFNGFHSAASMKKLIRFCSLKFLKMVSNLSTNSIDSDMFYLEQSSEDSPPRPNTPIVFKSMEKSGNYTQELISISSIASPEPQIVTIDSDSNEPTMPFGFGRQLPIFAPRLNNLNLPPNPFSILATLVVVNPEGDGHPTHRPSQCQP